MAMHDIVAAVFATTQQRDKLHVEVVEAKRTWSQRCRKLYQSRPSPPRQTVGVTYQCYMGGPDDLSLTSRADRVLYGRVESVLLSLWRLYRMCCLFYGHNILTVM
jgi:hypothetical protein